MPFFLKKHLEDSRFNKTESIKWCLGSTIIKKTD